ncbi:protein of unknown function DUF2158 [Vibrio phage 1.123.O._10N.286.48.F3]|nr:protein of unknown function DUF2158 [Vibrio phage 1.123.O._10N.286.48.F3]
MKAGDIVKLKSGGPSMTVGGFSSDSRIITCAWFDGSELKEAQFRDWMLIGAESNENESGDE